MPFVIPNRVKSESALSRAATTFFVPSPALKVTGIENKPLLQGPVVAGVIPVPLTFTVKPVTHVPAKVTLVFARVPAAGEVIAITGATVLRFTVL